MKDKSYYSIGIFIIVLILIIELVKLIDCASLAEYILSGVVCAITIVGLIICIIKIKRDDNDKSQ